MPMKMHGNSLFLMFGQIILLRLKPTIRKDQKYPNLLLFLSYSNFYLPSYYNQRKVMRIGFQYKSIPLFFLISTKNHPSIEAAFCSL